MQSSAVLRIQLQLKFDLVRPGHESWKRKGKKKVGGRGRKNKKAKFPKPNTSQGYKQAKSIYGISLSLFAFMSPITSCD